MYQNSPWAARFVGNVEGRDIYEGHVRVVICDGFVGNVLLKAGEGAVEFLFSTLKEELARLMPILPGDAGPKIAASLKRLKTRFEYEEFGGGPLLGIRGAASSATVPPARGRSKTPYESPEPWPRIGWPTASSNNSREHPPRIRAMARAKFPRHRLCRLRDPTARQKSHRSRLHHGALLPGRQVFPRASEHPLEPGMAVVAVREKEGDGPR